MMSYVNIILFNMFFSVFFFLLLSNSSPAYFTSFPLRQSKNVWFISLWFIDSPIDIISFHLETTSNLNCSWHLIYFFFIFHSFAVALIVRRLGPSQLNISMNPMVRTYIVRCSVYTPWLYSFIFFFFVFVCAVYFYYDNSQILYWQQTHAQIHGTA